MKMNFEKEIKKVLKAVSNSAEQCVDILKRESPRVVKEICIWEVVSNVVPFFLCMLAMGLSGYFAFTLKGFWYFLLAGTLFSFLISTFYVSWAKVWFAPRLFLIEYVKKMIPEKQSDYN